MTTSRLLKVFAVIIVFLAGILLYFIIASLTKGWLIEPTSARQILSDTAKISGTILAIFTTFTFFLMRERKDLLRETFTVSLFALSYGVYVLVMLWSLFGMLRIGSQQVEFYTISFVFIALPIALLLTALLIVLTFRR